MECLFLAGLAAEQSIPFSAIKVTSDFADNNVEGDFRKHIREGMKLLTHYLLQDSGMIKP
jgi:nucleoside phosphorylase